MKCSQKKCYGDLYCLESNTVSDYVEGRLPLKRTSQIKIRRLCCVECGARYISTEVLNPTAYSFRVLPKSKRKVIYGEIDN